MGNELYQYINAAQIESLHQPTAIATGLPGAAYTEQGFWELERQDYFPSRWMACAHACELEAPGGVMPVSIAGFELILTKDTDGVIRAFHNMCAHRGMRVLDTKQCEQTTLRCPWHSWTYDLQGRLVATPNLGGIHVGEVDAFKCSELGLREVRCETFLDLVFVNLDGDAASLDDYLSPLKARLADYDLSLLRPSKQLTNVTFEGNWKLVIEGGLEDYHLPWIHPQLGSHSGTFTPEWDDSGCYVGFTNRRAKTQEPKTGDPRNSGDGLALFPHLASKTPADGLDHEGMIFMVPPSAVIAVMSDHVVVTVLGSRSVDRTEQRRSFMYIGDSAVAAETAPIREAICESWQSVGAQDLDLARALQHQHRLRSEIDVPTRFSPHWEPAVHHFQQMVVDHMLSKQASRAN